MPPFNLLLDLPYRQVYGLTDSRPAVYLLVDRDAGGVLINTAPFSVGLAESVARIVRLRYIFLPSRFGAIDVAPWRAQTGAEVLAGVAEVAAVGAPVDVVLEGQRKLTRTLEFLPMSGRTEGNCVLHARNLPGIMFFGPALDPLPSGWPGVVPQADDYSYENRLFGALALRDLRFEYAFTDSFPEAASFGPGADVCIRRELDILWA